MKVRKAPVRKIRPLDYGMKPKKISARKRTPKKVDAVSIRPLDYGMKPKQVRVRRKAPTTKIKSLKLNTPRRRVRKKSPTAMQLFAKSRRS